MIHVNALTLHFNTFYKSLDFFILTTSSIMPCLLCLPKHVGIQHYRTQHPTSENKLWFWILLGVAITVGNY